MPILDFPLPVESVYRNVRHTYRGGISFWNMCVQTIRVFGALCIAGPEVNVLQKQGSRSNVSIVGNSGNTRGQWMYGQKEG